MISGRCIGCALLFARLLLISSSVEASTGAIAVTQTEAGKTPTYIGYNMGHYLPGSNTSAWVDYSDVNAFRVWTSPGDYEPTDDIAPFGDGVSTLSQFNARKNALRADPTNPSYIDFSKFDSRFKTFIQDGRNHVLADTLLSDLKTRGITPVVELSRSTAWTMTSMGRQVGTVAARLCDGLLHGQELRRVAVSDVQRAGPEHISGSAGGVARAIEDCIRCHPQRRSGRESGLREKPGSRRVRPVTIQGASQIDTWGKAALESNRTDYQGNTVNYDLFNTFDVHRYNSTGASFEADMTTFKTKIPQYNPSGEMMPVQYTEFNRRNSSSYAGSSDTPDTPSMFLGVADDYLGAIRGGVNGMYAFKFSQTLWDDDSNSATPDVPQKTGLHYVNSDYDKNTNPGGTNDITGATRSAGVVRLASKAFKGARPRLDAAISTSNSNYSAATSFDAAKKNYYLFGVNQNSTATYDIEYDLSGWDVQPGSVVSVEEVSAYHHGEVTQMVTVPQSRKITLSQPLQSVWLLTAPQGTPQQQVILPPTDDARVRNSAGTGADYRNTNYGSLTTARVGRTDESESNPARFDYATYLKFSLGGHNASDISRAIFQITGQSIGDGAGAATPGSILFHVYALSDDNWNENQITWANAPNLLDTDARIEGVGTSAYVAGMLTFDPTISEFGIDLSDLLDTHPELFADNALSLVLVREKRFTGDVDPTQTLVELMTREAGSATAPRLSLFVDVPEPGSMTLVAIAGSAALLRRRRWS